MTTPDDFNFLEASPPRTTPGNGGPQTPPLAESEIAQLLRYVPHGQMHPALTRLAGHYAAKLGPRLDEILAIIEPATAQWEQPVDLEKVRATVRDIVELERQKPPAGPARMSTQATSEPPPSKGKDTTAGTADPAAPLVDATIGADEFLTEPPALTYDIEGVRVEGDHGWTGGAPKSMKGLLSLEEARACATGTPFVGKFATRQCRVLYVSEEDRKARLHRRVYAMLQGRPDTEKPTAEQLRFLVKAGVRLDTAAGLEMLRHHIALWKPEIVFLEHFDKLHSADGNKSQDVKPLLDQLDALHQEFGCTFRVQKHNRKEAAGQSKRKGEMLAGSVSLFGWGESSLYLTLLRRGVAVVDLEAKDGDTAARFLVQYQDGKLVYAGEVTAEAAATRKEAAQAKVLEAVTQTPGETVKEIMARVGIGERTLRGYLLALEKEQLVLGKQESAKQPKRYWPKGAETQGALFGK